MKAKVDSINSNAVRLQLTGDGFATGKLKLYGATPALLASFSVGQEFEVRMGPCLPEGFDATGATLPMTHTAVEYVPPGPGESRGSAVDLSASVDPLRDRISGDKVSKPAAKKKAKKSRSRQKPSK